MPTRPHTLVPTSGHPGWQQSSKTPEFPKAPLAWLDCGEDPTHEQILEALAFAMTRSGKDVWDLGDDVMPPAIPSAVMEWLKVAPPWPAYRPAREAWLAACVFNLIPDGEGWRIGQKRIKDNWVREFVSRFLQLAGFLDPADKDSLKLLNATVKELNLLPWPDDQAASEDPISGWIRTVLVGAPASYVSTKEVFEVWQVENPDDLTSLEVFAKRLAKVIKAWGVSNGGKGVVASVENISQSCCRKYPHNNRPRGWAGLALTQRGMAIWKYNNSGGMEA